jgi:hypothetical protein
MAREQALAAVFWTIVLMLVWYARKLYRLRRLELQQRVDMSDDRATPSDDD